MKPILFVRCDVVDTFGIAPSAVTTWELERYLELV